MGFMAKETKAKYPLGVPQSELIALTMPDLGKDGIFQHCFNKATTARAELIDWGWNDTQATLERCCHNLHIPQYEAELSPEEICQMYHNVTVGGRLCNSFDTMPIYLIFRKLTSSDWFWGNGSYKGFTWDHCKKFTEVLKTFSWGLPGFEVYIDCVPVPCEYSYGEFTWTWLDGTYGLIIVKDGKHVATVTVSPTQNGLLVHQAQCKEKKGNRWLFQLGCPILEWAMNRLRIVCEPLGIPLYLIEGESAVQQVAKSYRDKLPADWHELHSERIRGLYNAPMAHFTRNDDYVRKGLTFHRMAYI